MSVVTVSEKGQMVIPARIRKNLAITAGTRLEILPDSDGFRVVLEPYRKTKTAAACIGIAGYKGPKIDLESLDVATFTKKL